MSAPTRRRAVALGGGSVALGAVVALLPSVGRPRASVLGAWEDALAAFDPDELDGD